MAIRYTRFRNGDGSENVTVFSPDSGELLGATSEHPNWSRIVEALDADDESVFGLFSQAEAVAKHFEALSDRVSVESGRVYFDGDQVDNALTKQIIRFLDEGVDDWAPLVNFWERLAANPNPHSVEQLYRWIEVQDIVINYNGMLLGYKGVEKREDGSLVSVNSGTAVVDGQEVTGKIPNYVGAVVTMPRSAVEFDPANGCSTGLHVGTYAYAQGWARGALLLVEVDPRDVVSVPTDCNSTKLRVCRYEVLEVIDAPVEQAVYGVSAYDDYDGDEEDYYDDDDDFGRCLCGDCGC
jgi:hypothetical protein